MSSLKERIADSIKNGNVALSSSDLTADGKDKKHEPVQGDVVAEVPKEKLVDPMVTAADKGDSNARLQEMQGAAAGQPELVKVEVSQSEREAFLAALVSGARFELPFNLFNGSLRGILRIRSQAESKAILVQITRELRAGLISLETDYGARLRSMMLTAQVKEMNGTAYPELAAPLLETMVDGKPQPAAWLKQVNAWENMSEGVVSSIYETLKEFEAKYWTMVGSANDQNFWKPVGST